MFEHFFDDSLLAFSFITVECQNKNKLVKLLKDFRIFGMINKVVHPWGKVFKVFINLQDGNDHEEFHKQDLFQEQSILKVDFNVI